MSNGIITDSTIIALHDTNLHYQPYVYFNSLYVPNEEGYAHQIVERQMVNVFKQKDYDLHTTKDRHNEAFPFRHGVSICQKFKKLHT